jgi:DNA-binding transcriptional regulator YiaG
MVDFMKVLAALNPDLARAPAPAAEKVPIRALRQRLGLSLEGFARRYGFPPGTVRHWEEGRRQPDAAACAYLTVISRDPKRIAAIFAGATRETLVQLTMRELATALDKADREDPADGDEEEELEEEEGEAAAATPDRRSPTQFPAPTPAPPASPAAPAASRNPDR